MYGEDSGTVSITLILSGPTQNETTVAISIVKVSSTVKGNEKAREVSSFDLLSSSFIAGEDFMPVSFEDIVIPPTSSNSTNITLNLTLIDDNILETYEVFKLVASVVGNDTQSSTLFVTIEDINDGKNDFSEPDSYHLVSIATIVHNSQEFL